MNGGTPQFLYLTRLCNERRFLWDKAPDAAYDTAEWPVRVARSYETGFRERAQAQVWVARNPHRGHNPFEQETLYIGCGEITVYAPSRSAVVVSDGQNLHPPEEAEESVFETTLPFFCDWLRDVLGIAPPADATTWHDWHRWYDQAQDCLTDTQKQALWELIAPHAYEIVAVEAASGRLDP